MPATRLLLAMLILWQLVAAPAIQAQTAPDARSLKLPALFSDHMVLQREKPVHVWGWAPPGSKVSAAIGAANASATADASGHWSVSLPAMQAGGPHVLTITSGDEQVVLDDVLVGDVWVASGQSNMEWPLEATDDAEAVIAAASHPRIRLFTVARNVSDIPLDDVTSDGWKPANPETVRNFSAVAYYFGRKIQSELDIPIGLLHSSWGGTVAEAWTSGPALMQLPDFRGAVQNIKPGTYTGPDVLQRVQREYDEALSKWMAEMGVRDEGNRMRGEWARASFDASSWKTMTLPGLWEDQQLPGYDGVVWFRKEIDLPAEFAGKEMTLLMGQIDDADSTWFNGHLIGHTQGYNTRRSYTIPAGIAVEGRNVILVRVLDTGGGGGIWGEPENMALVYGDEVITAIAPLDGAWGYQPSVDLRGIRLPARPNLHNMPTHLYNAMIAPLTPFPVKGAIWYQGESNAGRALQYRTLFPALIRDWRTQWKNEAMPFYFVQLANYMAVQKDPNEASDWPLLREAQTMTLDVPHTGMAVTIDIGEADDIHPRNKKDVGERLALAALHDTYGRDVVYSGPAFRAMEREGNTLRLSFDHVGDGLVAKGGPLKGFAIAGPDRNFVWADAHIDGNTIVVSSPQIAEPVAVRYGWANNPVVNLYNKEGLPAIPFRTDTWD